MKLFRKKGLSLLLALLLLLCLLPVSAHAASGTTGDLSWSLSGGTLSVTGKGDMPDYSDGAMAPWFGSGAAITRISVGEGVSSIGELAFYGCGRVTAVTLPSSVTTIGARAFKDCTALTGVRPLRAAKSSPACACPRGSRPSAATPFTAAPP